MQAPDWLTKRDGHLEPGIRDYITVVTLSGQPQYRLEVRPARGAFTAFVTQMNNGKRLDSASTTYPDPAAALAGGLEQLRETLGW